MIRLLLRQSRGHEADDIMFSPAVFICIFSDSKLFSKISCLKGVRQLRQDPVETLFSFICSSNNNISRISGMIDRMCQEYGEKIIEVRTVSI